ncbi:MAG: LbtU family siderophore porin [Desulfobacterales bacterium]|nr:LbtU family siderophore porin [Desulfobacterales bacterium]
MNKLIVMVAAATCFMVSVCLAQEPSESAADRPAGVKSLEDRIHHLEEAIGRDVESEKWYDRIQISGLVEVEAGYSDTDYDDPATEDETSSDVDLATVELVVDAAIVDHVDANVMVKYEDDDVFIDEGFIALTGTDAIPAYLIAGRQYIPFGNFETHFVTDPTTLVLGEINEGAAVAGYRFGGELIDVSIGAFNGRVDEVGEDDTVDSFVGAVVVSPFEGVMFGASYMSNLAGSDSLSEFVTDWDGDGESNNISSIIGGWSAFVTVEFLERFKVIGEYVSALDEFEPGELYDAADVEKRQPAAWNVEFGARFIDTVEVAARYGGSTDGGDSVSGEFLLPESEYGAVVNWGVFENTNLAFEYLRSEFENDFQTTDTFTVQLAVEF